MTSRKTRGMLASTSQTVLTWWVFMNYLLMLTTMTLPFILLIDHKEFDKKH